TAPSDPHTFYDATARVQARTIHVFGVQPRVETITAFLAHLEQAAQNPIQKRDGKIPIEMLAGLTAVSPQLLRAGLEYLVSVGKIGAVTWQSENQLKISIATLPDDQQMTNKLRARVVALFEEEQAYRRYFRTVPIDRLFSR